MKTKNSLKGFTLVELVIVMALFSLIMFSVLQLLTPVSKFFVRSANFETTTACLDNMKRAIEGNLKYADRVRCYVNFNPYEAPHASITEADYEPSADLMAHVQDFYDEFFGRRKSANAQDLAGEDGLRQYIDCRGTIYVLVFDNGSPESYSSTSLTDFNDNRENAGKLVLYEFRFDNTLGEFNAASCSFGTDPLNSMSVTPWYVNQKMYGNFSYQFLLNDESVLMPLPEEGEGEGEGEEPPEPEDPDDDDDDDDDEETPAPTRFNPNDCTVTIRMFEVRKTNGDTVDDGNITLNNNLYLDVHGKSYVSSFSMKNVLDPSGNSISNYSTALNDFKIFEDEDPANAGYDPERASGRQQYFQDAQYPIPRYLDRVVSDTGSFENNLAGDTIPGFYFIFTLPETTNGFEIDADGNVLEDDGYMERVNAVYPS
ncbi:MAG: prepilin-type N-terminal cleavage/methylation domain-containing protein [Oscillospiraceae bacterium]|nr:prepilin-type N-terminal cleavage/methylation domain-containing protein [Oscillospiraceae bacterium]